MKNSTQATIHRSTLDTRLFCVIISTVEQGVGHQKVALKDVDFEKASEFCVQYNKHHNPDATQETQPA